MVCFWIWLQAFKAFYQEATPQNKCYRMRGESIDVDIVHACHIHVCVYVLTLDTLVVTVVPILNNTFTST